MQRVSLVGLSIGDENVMLIAGLKKLPYLHLVATSVTDVGAENLTAAMRRLSLGEGEH